MMAKRFVELLSASLVFAACGAGAFAREGAGGHEPRGGRRASDGEASFPDVPASRPDAIVQDSPSRPDVILLIADQWRYDWTNYELPQLETPVFRYVAEHGTRFTRAVVPSPLCNPSRASLATGLRYTRHNVQDAGKLNELAVDLPTIYQKLREAGVWTGTVGKDDITLLGDLRGQPCRRPAGGGNKCGEKRTVQLGFEDSARCYGKEFVRIAQFPLDPYMDELERNGWLKQLRAESKSVCVEVEGIVSNGYVCPNVTRLPQDEFIDDWIARRAAQLVRRAPADRPLFLQVNYAGPHPPFVVTRGMRASLARNVSWPLARNSSTLDPKVQQLMRSTYAAGIQNIDTLNQGILEAVRERGRWNSSYVCILSDHGEMLGDNWDLSAEYEPLGKSCPWQAAISVPLACMGPGVPAGRTVDDPVSVLDLASTALDLQGASAPEGVDSVSLRDVLHGGPPDGRPAVSTLLIDNHRFSTAQRRFADGRVLKLICCLGACPLGRFLRASAEQSGGPPQEGWVRRLFDLSADPWEEKDVLGQHPEAAAQLAAALEPPLRGCGLDEATASTTPAGDTMPAAKVAAAPPATSVPEVNITSAASPAVSVTKERAIVPESPSRPDVILLIADQWRYDWTNYELPQLETPVFRYVAEHGTRFTRAVVPSPLCNPSRASLATGRRYTRHNVQDAGKLNELGTEFPTIYQKLREAGVWTATVGKDDLTLLGGLRGQPCRRAAGGGEKCGDRRTQQLGFEDSSRCYGKEFVRIAQFPLDPYMDELERNGWLKQLRAESKTVCVGVEGIVSDGYVCPNVTRLPQDEFIDDWIARRAAQSVRRAPVDKPLFLQVNYAGPHPPFVVTRGMRASLARNVSWPLARNSSTLDPKVQQLMRSTYAAGIQNIDTLNHGILEAVYERGRWNNSYVCILSDHGEMLGDNWDLSAEYEPLGKSCPWQAAISVPLACMGPGIPAGRTVDDPVSVIDLASTTLDLQGATAPDGVDSVSLRGLLHGGSPDERPAVSTLLIEDHRFSTAQRRFGDGRVYKLVCCMGACPLGRFLRASAEERGGPPHEGWVRRLFDLSVDPWEEKDVLEEHPEVAAQLAAALEPPLRGCGLDEANASTTSASDIAALLTAAFSSTEVVRPPTEPAVSPVSLSSVAAPDAAVLADAPCADGDAVQAALAAAEVPPWRVAVFLRDVSPLGALAPVAAVALALALGSRRVRARRRRAREAYVDVSPDRGDSPTAAAASAPECPAAASRPLLAARSRSPAPAVPRSEADGRAFGPATASGSGAEEVDAVAGGDPDGADDRRS